MRARVSASSLSMGPTYPFILWQGGRGKISWKPGPHSHSGGDVPDWDNTDSRERDEDAAWRDLIARFDAPSITEQPVPWPAREDVLPARPPRPPEAGDPRGADGTREAEQARGTDETG